MTSLLAAGEELSRVQGKSPITLEISDEDLSGFAGVNRYFGKIRDGLVVSPLGSTMMAGPQDLMDQEGRFLDLLGKVDRWALHGERAELVAGDETVITLRRLVDRLDGNWSLAAYNNGMGGFVSAFEGTTAMFADGSVSGSAGCNRYRATYSRAGFEIEITPPMATRMACPDEELMRQENRFLEMLPAAVALRFVEEQGGRHVDLFDETALRLIRFMGTEIEGTEDIATNV